jgi:transcriptional regulator with XRE-family HTH domain
VSENNELGIKQRFGKAIRRRRRELDLSQEQLAEQAGLHRTYISNLERGELNPSLETIEKLANALNISIPALFINYNIHVEHEKYKDF